LVLTFVAASASVLLLLVAWVLAYVLRPIRRRMLITLLALIVMLAATALERTWCDVLEKTARSGRVPASVLTYK
jgi:hypothetical protein